ncbi:MAG: hypothetical protein GX434_06670 [Peptococcaceae bacterium]|nr:hypothetical protein [Peptococcaceae bacterium]
MERQFARNMRRAASAIYLFREPSDEEYAASDCRQIGLCRQSEPRFNRRLR